MLSRRRSSAPSKRPATRSPGSRSGQPSRKNEISGISDSDCGRIGPSARQATGSGIARDIPSLRTPTVLYFSPRQRGEEIESEGGVEYARQTIDDGGQHEMIWFAWFMLALESLVIAIGLWLMWAMVSEASRAPTDAFPPAEDPPPHTPENPPESSDDPALFTLEEVDERGYMSRRKLHMGCEAAICRTPLG